VVALGQREQPGRERFQPRRLNRGQSEREGRPARRGPHRRQVGKIHRQRLVAERAGLGSRQKMPPLHQHVSRHREVQPGVGAQQRTVVAHAEQGALGRPLEVTPDKFELRHKQGMVPRTP
jgi:hypothetical protein